MTQGAGRGGFYDKDADMLRRRYTTNKPIASIALTTSSTIIAIIDGDKEPFDELLFKVLFVLPSFSTGVSSTGASIESLLGAGVRGSLDSGDLVGEFGVLTLVLGDFVVEEGFFGPLTTGLLVGDLFPPLLFEL